MHPNSTPTPSSLHRLGVVCGLAAGVWLGAAEAPTKLVNAGFSPFAISLCMVAGVFTARWTFPTLLKGTTYVFKDLRARKHLILWAILAGALWAVANTLTVFAIRDVGLAIAFPMWNTNSLIGLLWGRLLFQELKGADRGSIAKVLLGSTLIIAAAILLGFSTLHGAAEGRHVTSGLLAAAGASLMWGTMYIPYRKAYLSGMNPLSFVTVFTVGELLTMLLLVFTLDGGTHSTAFHWSTVSPVLFWLFLGGMIWVVGDLFQQFACKYLGIGRGIPLSNTNQLWGLAWGALVFGELSHADAAHRWLVVVGSIFMILGGLLVSTAVASAKERSSMEQALRRECDRYGLNYGDTLAAQAGESSTALVESRRWWDYVVVVVACMVFVWLASRAHVPKLAIDYKWTIALGAVLAISLAWAAIRLGRQTRFS